ncbi:unnamed protein product [Moneuplotes crassus]|uniref:Uncharacterized protein n=1 Tax=Euplotes crassus TaxID=5936 RepID=A0AAD1U4Z8_EUPCR|nr:unnamed protein product [Moneuplotes crassus]
MSEDDLSPRRLTKRPPYNPYSKIQFPPSSTPSTTSLPNHSSSTPTGTPTPSVNILCNSRKLQRKLDYYITPYNNSVLYEPYMTFDDAVIFDNKISTKRIFQRSLNLTGHCLKRLFYQNLILNKKRPENAKKHLKSIRRSNTSFKMLKKKPKIRSQRSYSCVPCEDKPQDEPEKCSISIDFSIDSKGSRQKIIKIEQKPIKTTFK